MTVLLWRPCPYHCGQMITPDLGQSDAEALDFHLWMLCSAVPQCEREWDSSLVPGVRRRCRRYVNHPGGCWD